MMRPLQTGRLHATKMRRERGKRLQRESEGAYEFRVDRVELESLAYLIRDVTESGARPVLHTPPVTPIYREVVGRSEGGEDFLEIRTLLASIAPATAGTEWHWCYDALDYSGVDFADWVHLNERGGRRYAAQLMTAASGRRGGDDWCADTRRR